MSDFDEPAKFEFEKHDSFEVNSSHSTTDTIIFASIRMGRNRSGAVPENVNCQSSVRLVLAS